MPWVTVAVCSGETPTTQIQEPGRQVPGLSEGDGGQVRVLGPEQGQLGLRVEAEEFGFDILAFRRRDGDLFFARGNEGGRDDVAALLDHDAGGHPAHMVPHFDPDDRRKDLLGDVRDIRFDALRPGRFGPERGGQDGEGSHDHESRFDHPVHGAITS